jgi:ferredoxin
MDLLTAAERIASLDRSPLEFKANECLHSLDKFASCEACFDLCPADAITPGRPPSLNVAECQTCLACLSACPVGAYIAVDVVPSLLNCLTKAQVKSIELLCEVHPQADVGPPSSELAIQTRGCLADLGTGTYVVLLAMGLEKVSIRLDACDQCPWGSLISVIENQISMAKDLAKPWDLSKEITPVHENLNGEYQERSLWRAENPPVSRRDLFRLSSYIAQPEILQSLTSQQKDIGNDRLSQDRRRILAALSHFPELPEDAELPVLAEMGFYELLVSEKCTACGVCARACPTSALDFTTKNNQDFWLFFTPQACIACDICLHICPEDAVTSNSEPSFNYLFKDESAVSLIEGDLVRCQKCNTLMNAESGSTFCSVCEFRRKNPFGTTLPPGYKAPPGLTQRDT